MSTKTGTATDYIDLLSKLRTFLTTDSTLTGLGQNWTELATNSSSYTVVDNGITNTVDFETYLKAPGLSGDEAIYINIQAYHNVANDIYNWRMKGAIGFVALSGSSTFFNQPNCSNDAYLLMWDQPMTYWFIANGQRVIIVTKVATSYESAYLGKFLPYGTSGQYPYPLMIAGSTGQGIVGVHDGFTPGNANLRYSDTSNLHACFFDPYSLYWLDTGNVWRVIGNWYGNAHQSDNLFDSTWPYFYDDGANVIVFQNNLDGSYPLLQARLSIGGGNNTAGATAELGDMDEVFWSTGFDASSESTITVGSDSYLLFQNAFRTSRENFVALKFA